jgi:dienelactone hydrolase
MKKQIFLFLAVCCSLWASAQNYPVGTRIDTFIDASRSNRKVIFNLYYPAVSAGANTAIANDSFPIIVFGHGFVIPSTDYGAYADTFAKRGFIVACPSTESTTSASHPNFAQDLILVHNKLISEGKTNSASRYYQKVIAKGAIGGHSMGGGATLLSCSYSNPATCYFTFAAANTNPSSISASKLMTKPYLDIAGLKDCVAKPSTDQVPMYDSSASPCKYYIGLANATHCQFATGGATLCYSAEGLVTLGCSSSPYLSKTQQTAAVLNYLIPYLYYYLKGSCPAWTQFQAVYAADATSTKKSSCNNIIPSNPTITGTTSFCAGGSTTLTANPAGFSYNWSNGITTQTNSITAANTYGVSVSNGTCTIVAPTVSVVVNNPPTLPTAIVSVDSVCANATAISFATTSTGAASYSWTLPSGWNITSANNIASITANASATGGTVSVSAINTCGTTAAQTKNIVIQPTLVAPTTITGADSVCANTASLTYSIPTVTNATGYTWTVPAGWSITAGSNTNQITVTSSTNAGSISVSALGACGNTTAISKNVSMKATIGNPASIVSVDSVCANASGIVLSTSLVPGANGYTWSLPSGWNITSTPTNANTVTVTAGTTGGNISVTANSNCGNSNAVSKFIKVNTKPLAPTIINGSASVCANATNLSYDVPTVAGANSYTWSLPSGWNITNGSGTKSITASVGANGGNISVTASNSCGASAAVTKTISITPAVSTPASITSPDTVCANATSISITAATVANATGYSWTLPSGWNITSASNTATITATASASGGTISVTATGGCGNSTATNKTIVIRTAATQPNAINGLATVCTNGSGISFDVPLVSGATSYNWTLPNGWGISSGNNTNSITVNAGNAGGQISVTASNACGTSAAQTKTVSVTQGLSAPTSITSVDSVCANAAGLTFTAAAVANATGYSWTLPAGWIITAGANTISITATASASAGNVSVAAIGSCGNGPAFSKNIIVKTTPTLSGTINGADTICVNQGTATFSVANGFAPYNWSIPGAWNLVSGQNTNSISVANIKTSGTVSVAASNNCGTGNSLSLNVVAKDTPTATITRTGNSLSASPTGASYQWYFNGGLLQGANSQTYAPANEGKYTVVVTDAFGCSGASSDFSYSPLGIENVAKLNAFVKVYPNPVADRLTIQTSFTSFDAKIFDAVGKEIKSIHVNNGSLEWNVADLGAGMYVVKVQHESTIQSVSFAKVQ